MLRGFLSQYPFPTSLDAVDEVGRALLRNTPMWSGAEYTMTSPLDELLGAMLPHYAELMGRGSYNY